MVHAYVPYFVYIGSAALWRRIEKAIRRCRFGLWHFVVLQQSEKGAQLQALPYPTASKSFLFSKAFTAKSCAQTDVHKRE